MARERIEFTAEEEPRNSRADREDISARAIHDPTTRNTGARWGSPIDLENDEETQFLRTEKRVPVRRGPIAKKTANQLKLTIMLGVAAGFFGCLVWAAYHYGMHAARFRIASGDNIEVSGVANASRAQVMDVARADLGKNIFFVPLDQRKEQLEKIPWVESAAVMRLLPNRISVSIAERIPVAFVQIGPKISLIDSGGVVMGLPASRQTKFSFPVIHGIMESDPALGSPARAGFARDGAAERALVMKTYNLMMHELDSGEGASEHYTRQISEVDLSDPEDVKATVNDAGGTVLVHLGSSNFLERYKLFVAHIGEWRRQYTNVQSVDLRWKDQIIVNPDAPQQQAALPASKPAVIQQPKKSHPQTRHKWRKKGK
jgi:cell division protein FtsQ